MESGTSAFVSEAGAEAAEAVHRVRADAMVAGGSRTRGRGDIHDLGTARMDLRHPDQRGRLAWRRLDGDAARSSVGHLRGASSRQKAGSAPAS